MHAYLKTLVVIAIAVELVPTDARAQEISRVAGTWVLNRAASTINPSVAPRSEVRTYVDRGEGVVRATHRVVDRRGNPSSLSYTAKHDGSEYRVVTLGEDGGRRTVAFTRLDAYTSDWETKLNGAVSNRGRSTVSGDGLTLTVTDRTGTVRVFDRREN